MPKTKLNVIKPFLAINSLPDGDVLHRLISVHDGMFNNPAYTTPPVDMAGFKAVIDAYATPAAQHDAGKNAVTERDKRRAEAILHVPSPQALRRGGVEKRHEYLCIEWIPVCFHGNKDSTAAGRHSDNRFPRSRDHRPVSGHDQTGRSRTSLRVALRRASRGRNRA